MTRSLSLSANTLIGFLGAGQLARMSAVAASQLGLLSAAYSGEPVHPETVSQDTSAKNTIRHPLQGITPLHWPGSFEDEEALVDFMHQCDVVTLENEFIDGALLDRAEKRSGTPILPSPATFQQLESKWLEKETFRKAGIPVTPYQKINTLEDLEDFAGTHGYPFLLKSSKGGYDGYGNVTVSAAGEHDQAFTTLGGDKGRELIAETFVPFVKELAVQVARNHTGTAVYPCCETIQENHICKTVFAPAPVDQRVADEACRLAEAAMEAIDGTGLFAFEFFLTEDGAILLNESAPRPHNSGHYTIEGCMTSQFENHIRAVAGLPLGSAEMRRPYAVMENLLGSNDGPAVVQNADAVWIEKDAHLHIYGKQKSRPGRKMGHLTLLGDDPDELRSRASTLAAGITI